MIFLFFKVNGGVAKADQTTTTAGSVTTEKLEQTVVNVSNLTENTQTQQVDNKVNSGSKVISSLYLALIPVCLMVYF